MKAGAAQLTHRRAAADVPTGIQDVVLRAHRGRVATEAGPTVAAVKARIPRLHHAAARGEGREAEGAQETTGMHAGALPRTVAASSGTHGCMVSHGAGALSPT